MREWNEKRGLRVLQRIANNNPIVRFVFEEMHRQKIHQADMAERMGYHKDTIRKWRSNHMPRINDLMDCLSYLGYDLTVVKKYRKGHKDDT